MLNMVKEIIRYSTSKEFREFYSQNIVGHHRDYNFR